MEKLNLTQKAAEKLGIDIDTAEPLGGGINSIVYKYTSTSGNAVLVKGYQRHQANRLHAECNFLRLANILSPDRAPKLIDVHEELGIIITEFILSEENETWARGSSDFIESAARFVSEVNERQEEGKPLLKSNATEGYVDINDHLVNVKHRIDRFYAIPAIEGSNSCARSIIEATQQEFRRMRSELSRYTRQGRVSERVRSENIINSPSDFGLHNAIRSRGKFVFIDFEFAGWDDSAKMICDFIIHPKNKVSLDQGKLFIDICSQHLDLDEKRIACLLRLFRLKWVCIVLGFLDEERRRRIMKVAPEELSDAQIEKRYQTAEKILQSNLIYELREWLLSSK